MNVRLLEPAEQELDEAVAYYNAQVGNIRSHGIPLAAAYGVAV